LIWLSLNRELDRFANYEDGLYGKTYLTPFSCLFLN